MIPPPGEFIKSAEVIITVTCLSVAGVVVLCKVVVCEFIDSIYDVREKREERKKKLEERRKGVGA